MEESDRKKSREEKIQIKIRAIPEIKAILKQAQPLKLRKNESTGRILIIQNHGTAVDGKYIVFQERTDIEEKSTR
jgi:hypothetical protein